MIVTEHKDIDEFGWNSIDHNGPPAAALHVIAQQLNLIGHVLVDIREALTNGTR